MSRVVIGMLVGMGPNSTAPFYDRVMQYARELYGATYDADFPRIVMISQPTPFYLNKPLDDQAMLTALSEGLSDLKRLAVNFVVIPCNVVHRYDREITTAIEPITFLNMVELAIERLDYTEQPVALLSTPATAESGIYQRRLHEKGFNILHNQDLQNRVNSLIAEIKAAHLSLTAVDLWKQLVSHLRNLGCSQAILACTDITPCLGLGHDGLCILDAGEILAKATIDEYIARGGTRPYQ